MGYLPIVTTGQSRLVNCPDKVTFGNLLFISYQKYTIFDQYSVGEKRHSRYGNRNYY